MFCAVISPVQVSTCAVVSELALGFSAYNPVEASIHCLQVFFGTMVLFTTPAASDLSVWREDFGCGHFISCNVCLITTISCAVTNIAPNYASEAEDMTNLMIFASASTGLFHRGMASFSERKMCSPALLCRLLSLWKPESECAQSTMLLER